MPQSGNGETPRLHLSAGLHPADRHPPFARDFAAIKYKFTPQEIKIAGLIRQGKKTKEIAEIMSLSIRTIEFHRTKIREKIGLQSQKDSLQAHLLSINSH
jgi:DNA-binding CsgD family transcriptional regulator